MARNKAQGSSAEFEDNTLRQDTEAAAEEQQPTFLTPTNEAGDISVEAPKADAMPQDVSTPVVTEEAVDSEEKPVLAVEEAKIDPLVGDSAVPRATAEVREEELREIPKEGSQEETHEEEVRVEEVRGEELCGEELRGEELRGEEVREEVNRAEPQEMPQEGESTAPVVPVRRLSKKERRAAKKAQEARASVDGEAFDELVAGREQKPASVAEERKTEPTIDETPRPAADDAPVSAEVQGEIATITIPVESVPADVKKPAQVDEPARGDVAEEPREVEAAPVAVPTQKASNKKKRSVWADLMEAFSPLASTSGPAEDSESKELVGSTAPTDKETEIKDSKAMGAPAADRMQDKDHSLLASGQPSDTPDTASPSPSQGEDALPAPAHSGEDEVTPGTSGATESGAKDVENQEAREAASVPSSSMDLERPASPTVLGTAAEAAEPAALTSRLKSPKLTESVSKDVEDGEPTAAPPVRDLDDADNPLPAQATTEPMTETSEPSEPSEPSEQNPPSSTDVLEAGWHTVDLAPHEHPTRSLSSPLSDNVGLMTRRDSDIFDREGHVPKLLPIESFSPPIEFGSPMATRPVGEEDISYQIRDKDLPQGAKTIHEDELFVDKIQSVAAGEAAGEHTEAEGRGDEQLVPDGSTSKLTEKSSDSLDENGRLGGTHVEPIATRHLADYDREDDMESPILGRRDSDKLRHAPLAKKEQQPENETLVATPRIEDRFKRPILASPQTGREGTPEPEKKTPKTTWDWQHDGYHTPKRGVLGLAPSPSILPEAAVRAAASPKIVHSLVQESSSGDLRRSGSRILPPVLEEAQEDEEMREKGHGTDRDSGFAETPSPLARFSRQGEREQQRDSGVHLREWPEKGGSIFEETLTTAPKDGNKNSKKSSNKSSNKSSMRSTGLASGIPPAMRSAVAGETAETAMRSVSDNTHVGGGDRRMSPLPLDDHFVRRSMSNTSLTRRHTAEPLSSWRSDSAGHQRTAYSATPPLRRAGKQIGGDLRSLSQRRSLSDLSATGGAAGGAAAPPPHTASSPKENSRPEDSQTVGNSTPVANEGRVREKDGMTDVYVSI